MTKSGLIRKLANEKNITNSVAEKVIDGLFESMAEILISGDRIEIRGFGSFNIREYDGYTGRNPLTGVRVEVRPKKIPFFKISKNLKIRAIQG
jgi:integration host factor subunit beta